MGLHRGCFARILLSGGMSQRNSMKAKYKVFSNLYQDSASLDADRANQQASGIQQASVSHGNAQYLEQLRGMRVWVTKSTPVPI